MSALTTIPAAAIGGFVVLRRERGHPLEVLVFAVTGFVMMRPITARLRNNAETFVALRVLALVRRIARPVVVTK